MLERETGFEFTLTKKNAVVKMLKCQKVAWGTVQKFKTIQRLEGLRGSKNESEKTAGSAQRERRRARLCLLWFRCELEFFTEGSFQLRDWQSECDRTIWVRPNYTCWKYTVTGLEQLRRFRWTALILNSLIPEQRSKVCLCLMIRLCWNLTLKSVTL